MKKLGKRARRKLKYSDEFKYPLASMLCYPEFTSTFFSRSKTRKTADQFMPFAARILAAHKKINRDAEVGQKVDEI